MLFLNLFFFFFFWIWVWSRCLSDSFIRFTRIKDINFFLKRQRTWNTKGTAFVACLRKLSLIQHGYILGCENTEKKTEDNLDYVMERVLRIYSKKELRKMERFEAEKWQSSSVFLSKNSSGSMVIGWREQNRREIKRVMLRLLVRNKKHLLKRLKGAERRENIYAKDILDRKYVSG